jgi:1-acyl-sn-glycerol-3-phosphate acyltransferase
MVTQWWTYEPAPDLDQSLEERMRHFPRQPDLLVYGLRSLAALLVRGWLRSYHRLTVSGRENLPLEKSLVMVANHSSHLDALCLLSALPLRKLHRAFPAAAADYFFQGLPRVCISAVIVNALPFEREVHIRQSLTLCRQLIANPGNILIIFPEGTRSSTGALGRFKPGIGNLLAGENVPVVPCHIDGAFRSCPKGRLFPRPSRIHLQIGKPRNYVHLSPGRESSLAIAADLRSAVRALGPSVTNH